MHPGTTELFAMMAMLTICHTQRCAHSVGTRMWSGLQGTLLVCSHVQL
jgi:hypothetical protein